MKAWELLGATSAPDGTDIRLTRRDDEYVILANGKPLMSSRLHGSEEALATLGCTEARAQAHPRVLVGGLGMGFTLRAVLEVLPSSASVIAVAARSSALCPAASRTWFSCASMRSTTRICPAASRAARGGRSCVESSARASASSPRAW